MAKMILFYGSPQAQVLELKPGVNSVGRVPGNDLVIADQTISSSHCEIVAAGISTLIKDLGSTNGTFVDGKQITESLIHDGQTLTLGKVPLRFEADPVQVSIPELSKPEIRANQILADGSIACLRHPEERAVWRCRKCNLCFCPSCVRIVGIEGGKKTSFCMDCSSPCDPITEAGGKRKAKGFLRVLGETLRMRRP